MSRLTINLTNEMHQALKETAVRTGRTIGSIIEEGLRLRGIQPMVQAKELVARARAEASANAALDEQAALTLAVEETRQVRGK